MTTIQPKVTAIVYRGVGLCPPSTLFGNKSAKWRVAFCLGRQKQFSPIDVASAGGNPVWDTVATLTLAERVGSTGGQQDKPRAQEQQLVIRVLCRGSPIGQVSLPLSSLPTQAEAVMSAERVSELEPTRRGGATPCGAIYYKCWLDEGSDTLARRSRSLSSPQLASPTSNDVADADAGGVAGLVKSLRTRLRFGGAAGEKRKPLPLQPEPPEPTVVTRTRPDGQQQQQQRWLSMADLDCGESQYSLSTYRQVALPLQPKPQPVLCVKECTEGAESGATYEFLDQEISPLHRSGMNRPANLSMVEVPVSSAEMSPGEPHRSQKQNLRPQEQKKWRSIIHLSGGSAQSNKKKQEKQQEAQAQNQMQRCNQLLESQLAALFEENRRLTSRLQEALERLHAAKTAALDAESRSERLQLGYESKILELSNFIDRLQARILDSGNLTLLDSSRASGALYGSR